MLRSMPGLRDVDLQALYEKRYTDEPFVDILPLGSHPETRSVRGSNVCRIAVHRPQDGDTAVILSVTDNLVKGAAGQAVQNMNLMFGMPESMADPLVPRMLPGQVSSSHGATLLRYCMRRPCEESNAVSFEGSTRMISASSEVSAGDLGCSVQLTALEL